MGFTFSSLAGVLVPVVAIVAVFTFVAIASWSENRRREREAYYRQETFRKIIEQPGDSGQAVLEIMRQEERRQIQRRVEGLRLGGLITTVVGVGTMIFLWALVDGEPVYLAGLIPLLIGLVLTFYGYFLAPRNSEPG